MAVYNTADYLSESIDSIINQTIGFENIELILVDDGSSDSSKDICLSYHEKYPHNIKYIYQENQGQAVARNNGMKAAKGKYLNFLDSDDKLELNALELVYDFFEKNYKNVDVVSIPMKFFDRKDGEHILNYKYESTRLVDLKSEPNCIQLSASSAFFKRKAIKNFEFDTELVVSEDAVFVNKILLEKCRHGVVSDTAYLYRKRTSKTSTIDSTLKKKEYYIDRSQKFFKALFDYSKDKYGKVLDFIKHTVMYDIQWMFDISDVSDVLDENELEQLYSILHELLEEIDDSIILNQKHPDRSLLKSILLFKHGNTETIKDTYGNNAKIKVGNYIIDELYYHIFYIDAVEISNDNLKILGFLKSFFKPEEIKIQAITYNKTEFLKYWVEYFNKNKIVFIKKEFLDEDGKNIKDYLLHSNNSYDNLNIAQYLKCDLNFNYEQTYNLKQIEWLIKKDLIDLEYYNKAYENISILYAETCGKIFDAEKMNYPNREKYHLNLNFNPNYNFELSIPLTLRESSEIKIRVSYDNINSYLDIAFNYYSRLTKESFYSKKEDYLIKFEDNTFTVIPYTNFDCLRFEKENINHLISKNESSLNNVINFRKQYYDLFYKFNNRRIWLFMDRPEIAGDNAEQLYKYAINQNDNIEKYFIISKDSKDYGRLKGFANVVEYKSKEHKLLSCFAEKIISSHPDDDLINPFSGRYEKYFNGLFSAKLCFLQHGIILNNISSWLHKYDKFLHLFVTSAKKEYESIFNNPYNYDESVVKLLGLPRYDNLDKGNEKNQIVIMPTWRRSMREMTESEIKKSTYLKKWNSLLNNEKLLEYAQKNNYKIIFKPHINVNEIIHLFDLDNVIFDDELSYQNVFNESKLLITDFSSVAFDFAYMKKPVLYYQWENDDFHFDLTESYFDYEEMGFGEKTNDENELIHLIKKHIDDDCQMKEKFKQRVDDFYRFTDKNNCKRVYDYILTIK